jgi:hypothetical protein
MGNVSICGRDIDDLLGYYTVKYVKMRDWKLGLMQKLFMVAIFVKIVIYAMGMSCQHLLPVPVVGSARANAQQPTKGCNPLNPECMADYTPMSKLPYCLQYTGDDAEEDGKKEESQDPPNEEDEAQDAAHDAIKAITSASADSSDEALKKRRLGHEKKIPRKNCVYWDAPAMTRGRTPVPGTLFLPTEVTMYKQKKGCEPNENNEFSCTTKPWVHANEGEVANKEVFQIADVERFTILINQAFHADLVDGRSISGRSSEYSGFAKGRPDLADFYLKSKRKGYVSKLEKEESGDLKVIAKRHAIPEDRHHPDSDFTSLHSIKDGDILSVADILKLADLRGADLLDEVRDNGETMRTKGAVIEISITYNNRKMFDFFGAEDPHYTISAKYMPMKSYKITYDEQTSEDHRIMHTVHGVLFLIEVKGEVLVWSLSHLFTFLSTALVSLALATTITDYVMQYCFGEISEHYNTLKYQISMDFGDLRQRRAALKEKIPQIGETYTPEAHKASAPAALIAKACEEEKFKKDEDLLAVICSFEQRLNRLDGVDPINAIATDNNYVEDKAGKMVRRIKQKWDKEVGAMKQGGGKAGYEMLASTTGP